MSQIDTPSERLIFALDLTSFKEANEWVLKLREIIKIYKVGLQLYTNSGPKIIEAINNLECKVFLDLKFHDIPATVSLASREVAKLGVYMFNVNAMGGYEMMRAAVESVENESKKLGLEKPKILAVTILTSLNERNLKEIGISSNINNQVIRLTELAIKSGMDGVVASPLEIRVLREEFAKKIIIATPGIRTGIVERDDQKRTLTPKEAVELGADYIIVGRPIRDAKDPVYIAQKILKEIENV